MLKGKQIYAVVSFATCCYSYQRIAYYEAASQYEEFWTDQKSKLVQQPSHAESADKRHEDALAKLRRTRDDALAVIEVAFVAAVGKACCDFPQVALPDRFTA